MKTQYWVLALALVAALALAAPVMAQQTTTGDDGYLQQAQSGTIDWGDGVITATGVGAPPAGAVNPAQARGMAQRAATVVARRNLLELIKGVQIDATTTVQNFMVSDDTVVSRIRGFLQNSQILDIAHMSDGSVEVTVGLNLRGGFADVVLPKKPKFNPSAPAQNVAPVKAPGKYTGLVVDARGLEVRPAMSPRIFSADGRELYGTTVVGREYAIQQGMVGYAKELPKAQTNKRVDGNPYLIKASETKGKAKTDLVIPDADADAFRALEESATILGQARVMIVLD